MSKIILITGTSTGLGIRIAIQAAAAGHTVYATMRNLAKRETLDAAAADAGVALNVLPLDVQDSDSVNAAVAEIIAAEGRIDTLINNADAGFVRTIRKARAGHVVTVSSVGGLVGQPFNEIYCAAKFAVEGFTEALASYVTPNFGINFTSIEPGGIQSEFAANVMKHVEATGGMLEDEYLPILQKYVGGAQTRADGSDIYQTADQVAEVVMQCIDAKDPPIRTRTSKWGEAFTKLKTESDPDGKKQQAAVIAQFLS